MSRVRRPSPLLPVAHGRREVPEHLLHLRRRPRFAEYRLVPRNLRVDPGFDPPIVHVVGVRKRREKNNDAAGGYGNVTVAGEQGFPGSQLPPVERPPTWAAGSVVNVSWAISANHGGGYVYRLCSADEELTEACFQQTILPFEGETSVETLQKVAKYSDAGEVGQEAIHKAMVGALGSGAADVFGR